VDISWLVVQPIKQLTRPNEVHHRQVITDIEPNDGQVNGDIGSNYLEHSAQAVHSEHLDGNDIWKQHL
jgi:hypothetical protein